jgi:hypothetical protein
MAFRLGRYLVPASSSFFLAGLHALQAAELPQDIWSGRYGGFPSLTVGPNGDVSMEIPAEAIAQAGGGSASVLAKDFLDHWASDSCFQSFDFHSPHKNLKVQIAVLYPEGNVVLNGSSGTLFTPSGYLDVVIDYEPSASVKCAPGS